jgi:hypothetical protein
MQVGPNQLASRLLKSRFRRLQLNAIPQEHLARQADKFLHRLNGLPFNLKNAPTRPRTSCGGLLPRENLAL